MFATAHIVMKFKGKDAVIFPNASTLFVPTSSKSEKGNICDKLGDKY